MVSEKEKTYKTWDEFRDAVEDYHHYSFNGRQWQVMHDLLVICCVHPVYSFGDILFVDKVVKLLNRWVK